jgi:hypothetical protein
MAKRIITHWQQIVEESNNGVDIVVGADVHKLSYSVAVLSANGVIMDFTSIPDDQGLLGQFKRRGIKITSLVYEAGFSGFSLAGTCRENGVPVKVAAASRNPGLPAQRLKEIVWIVLYWLILNYGACSSPYRSKRLCVPWCGAEGNGARVSGK